MIPSVRREDYSRPIMREESRELTFEHGSNVGRRWMLVNCLGSNVDLVVSSVTIQSMACAQVVLCIIVRHFVD
jgi:hypothetical protein